MGLNQPVQPNNKKIIKGPVSVPAIDHWFLRTREAFTYRGTIICVSICFLFYVNNFYVNIFSRLWSNYAVLIQKIVLIMFYNE